MIKTAGIDENGIDRLIVDLNDYVQQIMKNLYIIENLVDSTADFFQCAGGEKYRKNFLKFKSNIPTIKRNILSYTNDLSRVKQKYRNMIDNVVCDLNQDNH